PPFRFYCSAPPPTVTYPLPLHDALPILLTLITPTSPPLASRITSPISILNSTSCVFDQVAGAPDSRTLPVRCSVSITCCNAGDIKLTLTSDTSCLIGSSYTLHYNPVASNPLALFPSGPWHQNKENLHRNEATL